MARRLLRFSVEKRAKAYYGGFGEEEIVTEDDEVGFEEENQ